MSTVVATATAACSHPHISSSKQSEVWVSIYGSNLPDDEALGRLQERACSESLVIRKEQEAGMQV